MYRIIFQKIDTRPIMVKEILELLKNEPKLLNINNHIDPYEGFKKSIMNDM